MSVVTRWDFDPAVFPSIDEARDMVAAIVDMETGKAVHPSAVFTRADLAYRRYGFPELEPVRVAQAVAEASMRPSTGTEPATSDFSENVSPALEPGGLRYGFNTRTP